MAEITKLTTASLSSMGLVHGAQKLRAIPCGENIAVGDALCLRPDGKLWKATGAAANANAKVHGFSASACDVNEVLTPIFNCIISGYTTNLTPGAPLFLSGTVAGGLADAASTGGTGVVAHAISTTDIVVYQGRY